MTAPKWLAKLDPLIKLAIALVGLGILLAAYRGLPAQVRENTAAITTISATLKDMLCILTQPPGANPLDCIKERQP